MNYSVKSVYIFINFNVQINVLSFKTNIGYIGARKITLKATLIKTY